MNYRIDMDSGEVRKLVAAGRFCEILAHCQMNKVIKQSSNPFLGFSEAPINFAPSYCFDVGTDNYDSSAKARIPSYCDRILWRAQSLSSSSSVSCSCSSYSMSSVNASDHKPVVAILQLSFTSEGTGSYCSFAPIAPANIGAHGRMRFVTSGLQLPPIYNTSSN